jgi:hypothetical protein
VLREFGGDDVGDDDRSTEYRVQLGEPPTHRGFGRTNEYSVRIEKVAHGAALTQEFRVGRHMHIASLDDVNEHGRGSGRHRRSGDEHRTGAQHRGDRTSNGFDIGQVCRTIVALRRRDTYEDN